MSKISIPFGLSSSKDAVPKTIVPGAYVTAKGSLTVSASEAEVVFASGPRASAKLQPDGETGVCLVTRTRVSADLPESVTQATFPLGSGEAGEALQTQVRRWHDEIHGAQAGVAADAASAKASARGAGMPGWAWGLGGFVLGSVLGSVISVAAVVLWAFQSQGPIAQAPQGASAEQLSQIAINPPGTQSALAGMSAVPSGQGGAAQAVDPSVFRLSAAEIDQVNAAATITARSAEHMLLTFSDPLCPACRDLESEVDKAPGLGLKVVPVAFQSGSRRLVSAILCSADPAKAWERAIAGDAITTPTCKEGDDAVQANNELFASIGASATPTLMAPNGQLATGADEGPLLLNWTRFHTAP